MNTKDIIKDLASNKKITIAELERKLDFSNGTINKWNKQTPSSDKLAKVANYFDVSTDYLLGRTKAKNIANKKDVVDVEDEDVIMTFEGKPIPKEDRDIMLRFLRGGKSNE